MRAYEIAIGSYSQRGMLWLASSAEALPRDVPLWRSVFQYDSDELAPWLDTHNTLTGKYPGMVFADEHIVLDLDGPDALKDLLKLCTTFASNDAYNGKHYQCWMSGSKGFHVWMPSSMFGKIKADQVRGTLKQTFGHLKSLDVSMYHRSGLIRMPWSVHQKSGRKVIPVEIAMLQKAHEKGWVYAQLYDHTEERDWDGYIDYPEWEDKPIFKIAKLKMQRTNETKQGRIRTNRIICMQDMVSQPPAQGERHDQVLRAASWLRRLGLRQDMVHDAMLRWTGGGDARDTQRAVDSVFEGGLEYGCSDPIMDHFCDPKCIFYSQKAGMKPTIRSFSEQLASLKEFRKQIEEGKGINLKTVHPFSEVLRGDYWILPGECAVFTGDTGMGKSALVQGLIVGAQRRTLYLNLENAESLMTRRFIQIAMGGVDKSYVENGLKMGLIPKGALQKLDCISQVSAAPDIDGLENMVKDHQPEILVVDTTDVIEVPQAGNNEMWQLKRVIERLRKIAGAYDVIVIGIHHINKTASKDKKIDLNALSGNRANVTRMDHVFALKGIRKMKKRGFHVLKSRDSEMFSCDMMFDGNRMWFERMPEPVVTNSEDEGDNEAEF